MIGAIEIFAISQGLNGTWLASTLGAICWIGGIGSTAFLRYLKCKVEKAKLRGGSIE